MDWKKYNWDTTPDIDYEGLYMKSRVIDIYDGDTITCASLTPRYGIVKITIRLLGIDTCELKSKNEALKNKGYKARQFLANAILSDNGYDIKIDEHISRKELRNLLTDKICMINVYGGTKEKFGRLLGTLYSKHILYNQITEKNSYNTLLIMNKLAYAYQGKTKLTAQEQLELLS